MDRTKNAVLVFHAGLGSRLKHMLRFLVSCDSAVPVHWCRMEVKLTVREISLFGTGLVTPSPMNKSMVRDREHDWIVFIQDMKLGNCAIYCPSNDQVWNYGRG